MCVCADLDVFVSTDDTHVRSATGTVSWVLNVPPLQEGPPQSQRIINESGCHLCKHVCDYSGNHHTEDCLMIRL